MTFYKVTMKTKMSGSFIQLQTLKFKKIKCICLFTWYVLFPIERLIFVFVYFSDPNLCINASYTFIAPCNQQDDLQQTDYPDDMVNLGPEGYEEGEEYQQGEGGEYTEEYSQGNNADMPEDQMDYSGEHAECDDGYQDEVLDLEINEPIDGEFQVSSHIGFLALNVCTCTRKHTSSHSPFLSNSFVSKR